MRLGKILCGLGWYFHHFSKGLIYEKPGRIRPYQSLEGVCSYTTAPDRRSDHAEPSTSQQLILMQNLTDSDKGANATFCVI